MTTHINYDTSTIGGKLLAEAISDLILTRQKIVRLKGLADACTSGGAQQVLLETDPTWLVPSGTGTVVYTDISDLAANLAALTSLYDLDRGT
jgi:hypothetical protein